MPNDSHHTIDGRRHAVFARRASAAAAAAALLCGVLQNKMVLYDTRSRYISYEYSSVLYQVYY